jgi:hypothetical protein
MTAVLLSKLLTRDDTSMHMHCMLQWCWETLSDPSARQCMNRCAYSYTFAGAALSDSITARGAHIVVLLYTVCA